jgi:hypothetical protein
MFGLRMAIFRVQSAGAWPKTRLRLACLFDMKKVTTGDWSYGPLDVGEFENLRGNLRLGVSSPSLPVCASCLAECRT